MPDQPNERDRDRFEDLLGLLLDGEIREDELEELTALVKAEPEFTRQLQEHLLMDNALGQYENPSKSAQAFMAALEEQIEVEESGEAFVRRVVSKVSGPWLFGSPFAMAAVAALTLLVLASLWMSLPKPEPYDQGVAVAANVLGQIKIDGRPVQLGDTIGTGMVSFESGYLELEFYRGARVTIAGPAKLELVDSGKAICHYGKIRAFVPKVARGFTILTPESEVVDLGTEFGLEVLPSGETEVHVIHGEVEVYEGQKRSKAPQIVAADQAMRFEGRDGWKLIPPALERFAHFTEVDEISKTAEEERAQRWAELHEQLQTDERVIAYYDFEQQPDRRRLLANQSLKGSEYDGAIVGARWSSGPWPGKQALDFKRPGDRVRLFIPGDYEELTLSAWVRVDGLDRPHNSILLTDGYDPGEVHWQFIDQGDLRLGYRGESRGFNYDGPGFVDLTQLGRWFHLTSTLHLKQGTIQHYLDGDLIAVEKIRNPDTAFCFGDASIANWVPHDHGVDQIRTFNGRIAELILFQSALDAKEVERLALR